MKFSQISLHAFTLASAGIVLSPTQAFGQEMPARQDASDSATDAFGAFDTIVVTGTKTQNAENVQDVPLAVTAFNADSLDALNVRDIQSLSFSVPNVSLDQIGTQRGFANFSIRGLGINSSIPSVDPTVGVFVDGVYLGFNGGVVLDLFDLESVEILRGPQGVLFGRNVTGGAVLINTGKPTESLSGKFRAAVDGPFVDGGRGGANYTASAVISGPLVKDTLLFKIGAYYNKDEGYFSNLFDGSNHGKAETKILRGALEGRFGDLTLTGKLDYFTSDGDGPAGQNRGQFDRKSFDFAIDERGLYDNETWTASLTAVADIGPGTLTNIFGWRDYEAITDADIDSLPTFVFHSGTASAQDQLSNELRYAISTAAFDLTVGGFWFDQTNAYDEERRIVGQTQFFGGGTHDHEVIGLFASAEYRLADAFSVIAGIRWSEETKDADVTYVRPRPECSVVGGTCPFSGTNPLFPAESNGFSDKQTWRNLSPKLGLQYEFGIGQAYAHWTRGFRSGGYNFRITNAIAFEAIAAANNAFFFDEEKVDNFEIGGKFQSENGQFTLNLAAYYTDISDLQRAVNQSSLNSGVAQSIFNTADASIMGFEAEARMRVSTNLMFTANFGLIDDEYDAILFDISSDGMIDDADLDLRLPRVPEVTWGVGMIHELDLGSSAIQTRINFQHRDEFAYTDNNFGFIQAASNLDANVTWETPLNGLNLSVYGRNLLDEVQAGGDTQLPFGAGDFSNGVNRLFDPSPAAGTFSPLNKGRQVGLEAVYEF